MDDDYPLREVDQSWEWRLDEECRYRLLSESESSGKAVWLDRDSVIKQIPRIANDWLAWHPVELFEFCNQYGLAIAGGMRFSTVKDKPVFDASFGTN